MILHIYVAAPWKRKAEAIEEAKKVEALGHYVTSRWFQHEGDPNDTTGSSMDQRRVIEQACEDIDDIHRSHAMIVLNLEKSEGKSVETGIALEIGMPIACVGPRGNVFQALVHECQTIEEAVEKLEAEWADSLS